MQDLLENQGKSWSDFCPALLTECASHQGPLPRTVAEELRYDPAEQRAVVQRNLPQMNGGQRRAHDAIVAAIAAPGPRVCTRFSPMAAVPEIVNAAWIVRFSAMAAVPEIANAARNVATIIGRPGHAQARLFFVDGPGGTGKTFLYKTLLATVRARGDIALAVASSGIAALLLEGGRTAHSRLKIPIPVHSSSVCRWLPLARTCFSCAWHLPARHASVSVVFFGLI